LKNINEVWVLRFRRANDVTRREAPSGAEGRENAGMTRKSLMFSTIMDAAKTAAVVVAVSSGGQGCMPDVNITNKPYDPTMPDGGACLVVKNCNKPVSFDLRESSSSAGKNSATVEGATVSLGGIEDKDNTKAAKLKMEACSASSSAEETLKAKSSVRLTVGGQSFDVYVKSISYDSGGVLVSGTVTPVCGTDGGVDTGKTD
jgi:hypothetical protein